MERILLYIRIFPGTEAEYDRRHAEIWPELVAEIQESGIRNFTGFRRGTDVWYYGECHPDVATAFARPRPQAGEPALEPVLPRRHRGDRRRRGQPPLLRRGLPHRRGPALDGPMTRGLLTPRHRPRAGRRLRGAPRGPVAGPHRGDRRVRLPQLLRVPARRARRLLRRVPPGHGHRLRAHGAAPRSTRAGARRSRGSSRRSPTPTARSSRPTRSTTRTDATDSTPCAPHRRGRASPSSTRTGRSGSTRPGPRSAPTGSTSRAAWPRRSSDAFEPVVVAETRVHRGRAAPRARSSRRSGCRRVLVLQTMAVPSAYTLALLDALPGVPVVIWALHETGLVDGDFDHGGITTQGATVGAPMLTEPCSRGRAARSSWCWGAWTTRSTLGRVRRGAAARGGGLAGSGGRGWGGSAPPIDGYLHVDVTDDELRAGLGIEVGPRRPRRGRRARTARWRRARCAALDAEVRAGWDVRGGRRRGQSRWSGRCGRRSRSRTSSREHRLDGGAFNCHVPQFRFGDPIGIAPCWGLGRLTSMGMPVHVHRRHPDRGRDAR